MKRRAVAGALAFLVTAMGYSAMVLNASGMSISLRSGDDERVTSQPEQTPASASPGGTTIHLVHHVNPDTRRWFLDAVQHK